MGRAPCCENKEQLKKGPWTPEEDQKLIAHIHQHGHGCWKSLPRKAGLLRCGKSCRLRWANYLRPGIRRGGFTLQEEQTIIQLHALLGNKWSAIATHLERRTDNEVKNYWNTRLKKRLVKMGIDPTTHKPTGGLWNEKERQSRQLSHIAQWENARLEAETRLRTGSYKMDLQSHPYSFNFMNTKTISPDLQQETSPFCTAPDAGKILGTQNSFPSSSEASVAGKESSSVNFYDELGTLSAGSLGHNGDMVLDTNPPTLNEENKDFWSNILDSIL